MSRVFCLANSAASDSCLTPVSALPQRHAHAWRTFPPEPLRRIEACSKHCPKSRMPTRSSSRCSIAGSASRPSRPCGRRIAAARSGRSSTARSPRTRSSRVHTAWGRTLKDVFQRYKALRGFDQRYQNGFDCQGLWIEVGVERQLGFNSKREIEAFGLEEFARRCREVVVKSSEELTRGSIRLGQWMDWGNDYFTFSDRNIEYIWGFLKTVEREGLAVSRPPRDRLVPALRHVALAARADPVGRLPGEERPLAVRPLPAARPARRVDRRLDDDPVDAARQRRRGRAPRGRVRPARERRVGARGAVPRGHVRPARARLGARRPALRRARSTTWRRARASSTGSSRGTRSRSSRAPGSSTSRPAAAPRTSSSAGRSACPS